MLNINTTGPGDPLNPDDEAGNGNEPTPKTTPPPEP